MASSDRVEMEKLFAMAAVGILQRAGRECDLLGEYYIEQTSNPLYYPEELLTAMRELARLAYDGDIEGIKKLAAQDEEGRKFHEECDWWTGTLASITGKRARVEEEGGKEEK